MTKRGLRDAIVTSLLVSMLVCTHAFKEDDGKVFRVWRRTEEFSRDELIKRLDGFTVYKQDLGDVNNLLTRTKDKSKTTLGNRSVDELLDFNRYYDCSIEGLLSRKKILDETHFNAVREYTARRLLYSYVKEIFPRLVGACNEILEELAFKLEPSEKESLESLSQLSDDLKLVRGKLAIEVLNKLVEERTPGIVDICKKVVERVKTMRSQIIHLRVEKEKNRQLIEKCADLDPSLAVEAYPRVNRMFI
jgi:hypothetical protein